MKLGIVVPLKAKIVSKDWDITCKNLLATINSVCSQSSQEFECLVVGHDAPGFFTGMGGQFNRVHFLHFETFPPPETTLNEADNQRKYEFDRCHKILAGIIQLKSMFPDITHWFSLDADDILRNDFVEILQNESSSEVIILDYGYVYFKNTGIINEENEFSAYCGSSAAISSQLIHLPSVVVADSYRSIPFGSVSHVHMKSFMIDKGIKVTIPKERIIMYVRDNGENISNAAYCNTTWKKLRKFIKMILKYKRVDSSIKESFGLDS